MLLPIAPDEPARLRELIADALESDLVLLAGGVSMGKYDLVEAVLAEFGAEFFFTGVFIQPGKPAVFGRVPCGAGPPPASRHLTPAHVYFFGLPGNPVSTMVTFELFSRPVLEALAGMSPRKLAFLQARLKSENNNKNRPDTIPAGNSVAENLKTQKWNWRHGMAPGTWQRWPGQTAISSFLPDRNQIAAGESVAVLMRIAEAGCVGRANKSVVGHPLRLLGQGLTRIIHGKTIQEVYRVDPR